ncbi:MAG TPA: hypothetical protein VH025_07030, partial [Solirubrobacteraceae bacterium]|nr:hypothetical protein [Solirubrobacteraceae bacterium]
MDGKSRNGNLSRWIVVILAVIGFGVVAAVSYASRAEHRAVIAHVRVSGGESTTKAHPKRKPVPCFTRAAIAKKLLKFSSAAGSTHTSVTVAIKHFKRSVTIAQAPVCAPSVTVGHSYEAAFRYRTSAHSLALEVLTYSNKHWHVAYTAKHLKEHSRLTRETVQLRPIGKGVSKVALAFVIGSKGSLAAQSFTLADITGRGKSSGPVTTTTPPPSSAATPEPPGPGQWHVLETGIPVKARSVHAILLQNGKVLIMAGSGNNRMEFEKGSFESFIYDPVANTWKEIATPYDVFCAGHVQLPDGNVLIVGGTKEYPEPTKPGELPKTEYKGENASA